VRKVLEGLSVILVLTGLAAGIWGWLEIRSSYAEEEQLRTAEVEEEQAVEAVTVSEPVEEPEEEDLVYEEEEADPAVNHLAYDLLDEETKLVYQDILKACEQHEEKIELHTMNEDLIDMAYQAVTSDYGGLFWVSGYTYTIRTVGDQVTALEFAPNYVFSQEERTAYQNEVDAAVENYLADIAPDASDYEKVKYVYETLINHVTYNLESKENQNILSVFLYGESVCNGYASATQYLLTLLDLPCMIVYGTSEGENHAWNLVYEDGEPYFLDCTWGSTTSKSVGDCFYAYLNLTSSDIAQTHQSDMYMELPECTSTKDNYYVQEGLFFSEYDEAAIGEILSASYMAGDASMAIKFSSDEVFQQVREAFITNMKTVDYCPGLESVSYVADDKLRILTFMW
jgi:hypothetical protein